MAMLYLVRHGRAKAGWGSALDPGLDDTGWEQAKNTAEKLSSMGPLDIVSSPLARARETSQPLSDIWGVIPRIEERVGEIVSPTKDLGERTEWLRDVMGKNWSHLEKDQQSFRQGVIDALCEISVDTVVFTHFIAINAAVGAATNDDRVMNFLPDNGSVTVIDNTTGLVLAKLGAEDYTHVG